MNIKEFSTNLQKLYEEMSASFGSYQKSTQWNCMSSCSRCCANPDIEASVLEMIPMAFHIYQKGLLEDWLEKLQSTEQNTCLVLKDGRCSLYEQRPAVCRMFGVAGYFNKKKEVTLSVCKYLREEHQIHELPMNLDRDQTPMIVDWTYKMMILDPKLIQEKKPINEALLGALEKIAFHAQYQPFDAPG